jgi:hypothetical protein
MAVNPLGAVQVYDFGKPKVITGYAREVISGGQFVCGSTAAGVVTSGLASFTQDDMKFFVAASGNVVNGIALNTAASGALVSVALDGVFIVTSAGTIVAGAGIGCNGADAVLTNAQANGQIGRALTGAGSEGFTMANFNF